MDLSSQNVNNKNSSNSASHFEVFFSGGDISASDGLIYKDIMIEGEWAYRPGPGQKPTPIPLKVVSGYASTDDEIGMSDLIDAFDSQAIDHVTIPTSHDDKPHENTGYVKKLVIVEGENGKKVLRAGLEFTEPDIKEKATRGSIANTSAGIIFDYIKKDTGKKFRQVLGHVALTNKPWLNGMKPFGVNASEEDIEIVPLVLADVVWNNSNSFTWIKDQVSKSLEKIGQDEISYAVADVSSTKALVYSFDNNSGTKSNYVVPFTYKDGTLEISDSENWVKASREWVETSLAQDKTLKDFNNDSSLSEEAPINGGDPNSNEIGGKDMGSDVKDKEKEETVGAPSDDSAQTVLSDEAKKSIEELEAKFSEQREADEKQREAAAKENEELRAKIRSMEVDQRIEELKKAGFSSQPGLLDEIRGIMLADSGKQILTLSEDDSEVALSATDIVDRIVEKMPKDDDGRIKFGDQALAVDSQEAPPQTPDTNMSEEESTKALAEGLGIKYRKDGDA
jgi:hypothetical protein